MSNLFIPFIGSARGCFRVRILYWPFHRGCFICSKCLEIKYFKTTRSLLTSTSFSGRRLWSTLLGDRRNLPFPNSSTLSDYQYFRCVTTLSNSSFPSVLSLSNYALLECFSLLFTPSLYEVVKYFSGLSLYSVSILFSLPHPFLIPSFHSLFQICFVLFFSSLSFVCRNRNSFSCTATNGSGNLPDFTIPHGTFRLHWKKFSLNQ